jgi:uncharacterized protein
MEGELSLLVKPVSADCNMRCEYCFYRRPDDPYRSEGAHLMDDATLRAMIAGYMKSAGRGASFGWQGGEPLLAGIDFFRRVVAYQQQYGLSGQLVSNNLQTNGLLIDAEWAAFFRQYHFFIGVSLDGPEALHSRYRHLTAGEDGFGRTLRGIQALRDGQVEFSILSVVNDATAARPAELYDFYIGNGFNNLQFIPCVEWDGQTGRLRPYSVGPEAYRDFLCGLFDRWYNGGRPVASIRLFENILAVTMGVEPEICAFKERCGSYLVVEYNGDIYPCDFFVEREWMLGNLRETPLTELMKKRRRREFNGRKTVTSSGCGTCEWNFLCHFGCQHYRSAAGENVLCGAYREFFRYAAGRFRALGDRLARGPEA